MILKLLSEIWDLFQQQLNLTILFLAGCLYYVGSFPGKLVWGCFAIFEIGYFAFAADHPQLREQVKAARDKVPLKFLQRLRWQPAISWLLLLCIAALIVKRPSIYLPGIPGRFFTAFHAKWEIAALLWNMAFASISLFSMRHVKSEAALKIVSVVFFVAGGLLTSKALGALANSAHSTHLAYVLSIAGCYLLIDLIAAFAAECPLGSRRWLQAALYADLPTVITLIFLFLLCAGTMRNLSVFLSGAIAFQFIASATVLAFIESNMIRPMRIGPQLRAAPKPPRNAAFAARSGN